MFIPRPFDFDANKDYLISVNNALKDMAKETCRCEYLPSYRSLMKRNHPKANCFKKSDGLHLSEDGTITLKRYFICKIVELFRKIWTLIDHRTIVLAWYHARSMGKINNIIYKLYVYSNMHCNSWCCTTKWGVVFSNEVSRCV